MDFWVCEYITMKYVHYIMRKWMKFWVTLQEKNLLLADNIFTNPEHFYVN